MTVQLKDHKQLWLTNNLIAYLPKVLKLELFRKKQYKLKLFEASLLQGSESKPNFPSCLTPN